jgi:hypothetical protein
VLRVVDGPQPGGAGERWLRIEFGAAGADGVCLQVLPGARRGVDPGPDAGWTGAWVSALGLVEPVQTDNRHALPRKYVAITITDPSQLRTLGESEARRRLKTRVEWLGRQGADGAAVRTEPAIADGEPVTVTVLAPVSAPVNLPRSRRVTAPVQRHESAPESSSEPISREPLLEIIDASALEPSELVPLPRPLPRRRVPRRPAIVIAATTVVLAGLALLTWQFVERRAARNVEAAQIATEPLQPLRVYVQRLPPVLESQRVLDTSTGGAVNTVAGPLAVREGNGENCRYGLVLGESPVDGLCEDRIELAHLAVYSDRDVVVGFVRCEADDEPCGRRRPFWLELRAGKPPTLRRTVKVWAGADPGPVRATSEHTQVDLGVWDGERRIVALTTSGYLVVERAPAPPKPLDRADCSLVARVLESCADSRDCGSFEASARQIRDAHWTRMQLIYHESTGFDVAAFRRLCVRACELGLTPSYSLIRRYACSGSVPGQWTGVDGSEAPALVR